MTDSLLQDASCFSVSSAREALIENALDSIFGVDTAGNIRDVNQAAEKLFSLPRARLLGRPVAGFLLETDAGVIHPRREARALLADGREVPVEVTEIRLRVPEAALTYVQLRDLREQKNHEAALLEALRVRDEFLSVASHELKTPLTPIKLQIQNMELAIETGRAESISVPRLQKMIRNSCRQMDRLIDLVDDLLDYSRINAGRLRLSVEPTAVSELVLEICEKYEPQARAASCTLEVDIAPAVFADLDSRRLEQVLSNLLTNAFRHAPRTSLHVQLTGDAERIQLRVRDAGPGITPADQVRIFNRFEQVKNGQGIGGLGLGLFICRQIVEAHAGRIWVEPATPSGSIFVVELPR